MGGRGRSRPRPAPARLGDLRPEGCAPEEATDVAVVLDALRALDGAGSWPLALASGRGDDSNGRRPRRRGSKRPFRLALGGGRRPDAAALTRSWRRARRPVEIVPGRSGGARSRAGGGPIAPSAFGVAAAHLRQGMEENEPHDKQAHVVDHQRQFRWRSPDAGRADARRPMYHRKVGAAPVTDDERRWVGTSTGRDALGPRPGRRGRPGGRTTCGRSHDAQTRKPCHPDRPAIEALRLMQGCGFRDVPAVDRGKVVGAVSKGDFLDSSRRA